MAARGALISPWIFSDWASGRAWQPDASTRVRVLRQLASYMQVCALFFSPPFALPPSLPLCTARRGGSLRAGPRRVGRGQRPRLVPGRALVALQAPLAPHARTCTTHTARARIVGAGPLKRSCGFAPSPSSPKPLRTLCVSPPCVLALILTCALPVAARSIMATHRVAGAWRRPLSRGTWASSANTDNLRPAVRLLREGLRVEGTLSRWRRCCGAGMSGST